MRQREKYDNQDGQRVRGGERKGQVGWGRDETKREKREAKRDEIELKKKDNQDEGQIQGDNGER